MNMGIEPFLVASSLNLICAQRLVRRICKNCSEPHPQPPAALMQAGFTAEDAQSVVPNHGKGCDKCNNTGYKGRVGLYEVMEVTEELRELLDTVHDCMVEAFGVPADWSFGGGVAQFVVGDLP